MKNTDTKIYKGNIIFTKDMDSFIIIENGYIVVKGSKVVLTSNALPSEYETYPIKDYGNKIIIPGFNDMHNHAAQYRRRALCLDFKLIDWLFECIFTEEAKFSNIDYAKEVFSDFIDELWSFGSTRSLVFTTIHKEATKLLFDMFIQSGLGAYIGKVNMDINSPDYLREETNQSLIDTEEIIREYQNKSPLVKPIISPRFIPSCSSQLLKGLGELAQKYDVPVMSHLSEDIEEMKIVASMYPNFPSYGSIYSYFGLLGQKPTVMAHCIYSNEHEKRLLSNKNVIVAHCPTSNCNLASGMMKAREYLNKGIKIALGTDIGGGGFLDMFSVMSYTMATSKMVSLYTDEFKPLTSSEIFYLATKSGGAFFGKVGSFEPGYEFDALVIDDSSLLQNNYDLQERIERLMHLGSAKNIIERLVAGKKIERPNFDNL